VAVNVMTLHLKEYFLTKTPFYVLSFIFIVLCAYGVFLGVEVVIRFSIFGFIMILMINITMILGTIADFEFINLLPVLDRGIVKDTIASIYTFSDATMVILAVGMLYPMLNNKKGSTFLSVCAMLVAALVVITWPIFEIGVLGADVMKQFVVVCMQQVRSAQLTRYLPRYELIMVSFFVWGLVVQCTVMLYCCLYSIKQVTRIKTNWKILAAIVLPLTFLADYMGRDHNRYIHFLHFPWSQISAALGIGIPILLLTAALVRGKLRDNPSAK
jgi:Spore germination protein.